MVSNNAFLSNFLQLKWIFDISEIIKAILKTRH